MESSSKRYAVLIILLGITIFLMVFLITSGVSIYKKNKADSETISKTSINCLTYSLTIEPNSIKYENSELKFLISNSIGEPFSVLIIKPDSGLDLKMAKLSNFNSGTTMPVTVKDITIAKTFKIYPEGCEGQNEKTYSIPPSATTTN